MSYENDNNNGLDNNNLESTSYYSDYYGEDTYAGKNGATSTSYNYSDGISKVGFEENVLSQSFVFMAIALAISAFTALYVYNSPSLLFNIIFNDAVFYGLIIAELLIVIVANVTVSKNLIVPSAILFTLYSVVNGATLSVIFLAYTSGSIVSTFFITAGMFGVMALYGIFTKKNLSSLGSLCMMGLIGIILAGLVNMIFLKNSGFDLAISVVGILIFVGLTAYDTQKIKNMVRTTTSENITCIALMGALELYLDFINIFLKLLSILGKNRD